MKGNNIMYDDLRRQEDTRRKMNKQYINTNCGNKFKNMIIYGLN